MTAVPNYYYTNTFSAYEDYFRNLPNVPRTFGKSEPLWELGKGLSHVYYIVSGLTKVSVVHEEGYEKLLYFVGSGFVYPGCHLADYKIEQSFECTAITEVQALEFDRQVLHDAVFSRPTLAERMIEVYASWINLHIYESAHQTNNLLMTKLCNLLYLIGRKGPSVNLIHMTQNDMSSVLCATRESVSRHLSELRDKGVIELGRGAIRIIDPEGLQDLCSRETVSE